MTANAVRHGIGLANAAANALRLAAATVGPPLLRLYGDEKDGKPFAGLVQPGAAPSAQVLPFDGNTQRHSAQPAITFVCSQCHSDDVVVEVESYWDDKAQDWRPCHDGSLGEAQCSRCGPTILMQRLLREIPR